jgi:hypothetical protein
MLSAPTVSALVEGNVIKNLKENALPILPANGKEQKEQGRREIARLDASLMQVTMSHDPKEVPLWEAQERAAQRSSTVRLTKISYPIV